jgi:hypothetical protein
MRLSTHMQTLSKDDRLQSQAYRIGRTNTRAGFDCAGELLDVKSPSEFFELSTAQMRKQFDIASAQNKELCALAQETATEAAESIKTGVSKAFNKAT